MERIDPAVELALIKRELAKNPPTDETVKKYATQRIKELTIEIRGKENSAKAIMPVIEVTPSESLPKWHSDSVIKSTKSKINLTHPKVQASIYFCAIGSITWSMSPIKPIPVIALMAFSVWLAYGVFRRRGARFRNALIVLLLTTIEIFGVATWRDCSVTTYASALCRDRTYSYAATHQGACSWHGGVIQWNPEIPPWWRRF
jgi:Protein of unknown function (DUF3761)